MTDGDVFGRDGIAKIGVIEVDEDFLPGLLGLLFGGAQVVFDRLGDRLAAGGSISFLDVRGVHVNGHAFGLVADFFALDHQELARLFDKLAEFIERLEPDFVVGRAGGAARFDPIVAEARDGIFRARLCRRAR